MSDRTSLRRRLPRIAGGLLFAILSLTVLVESGAEAVARQDTTRTLTFALQFPIVPSNAFHAQRLADLTPDHAEDHLRLALTLNPRLTSARISLGLAQEHRGDFADAEATFLEAERLDHLYLPAWTLANYYFRLGHQDEFWRWAARAAQRTFDDYRPLFRLAAAIEPDPELTLDQLGPSAALERAYLDFLIASQDLPSAERVALRLEARRDPGDLPRLANLVTLLIQANRSYSALRLWNARVIPLDPARGPVLTNGDFSELPTGAGFDWTLNPAVTTEWSAGSLAFHVSTESVTLLEQPIPIEREKCYTLQFEYQVAGAEPNTNGPSWEWQGVSSEPVPITDSWQSSEHNFAATNSGIASLRFVYQRRPGTVPFRGTISLRNVRIQVI